MKSTIVLGIGATLLASCSGNRQKAEEKVTQQQKKPNVIFLIADDIGYGDLSCNGSKTIHTPNVERLAAQGVRFTDAHAVAATSTPSRYSLFTGHYAWRRNDTGIAAGNAGMVIRPEQPSYEKPFPGEPLGKDHPELLTKLKPSPNHGHDMAIVNGISRIGYMKGGKQALWEDENIADSITCKAVRFIENHKDEPFFLYVGTNDAHVPRWPHPRFVGKSGMGPRGDALLQFDWTVGEIMGALEKAGIAENTLIVLSSDNGPVVDDGYADRAVELLGEHRPWGPFRGGKYSIFEAGTRVPMIVSWPAQVKPGVSDALVSQIDLYASMASLMGKPLEEGAGPDSRDHLDAFLGKDLKGRDYVVEVAGSLSVSDGEWKYIAPSNGAAYAKLTNIELGNSKEEQLYNLKQDIGEKKNLAAEHPEIVAKLKAILEKEKAK